MATRPQIPATQTISDFNPRPPRGGRHKPKKVIGFSLVISIHALRGEGDSPPEVSFSDFSRFQSTPSAGRATNVLLQASVWNIYFNPRPPRGGRRAFGVPRRESSYFNPRPPRGGRPYSCILSVARGQFQSTPSAGRATFAVAFLRNCLGISIHALRGEGDITSSFVAPLARLFQSTPSAGRATRIAIL